jgi:hypothetical protein
MRPTHNLIMPKWVSPLFTDIRNGLGESVVFSMWKGRPYFRSWVRPANPRTNLQQVRRDIMRNLVARYQSEIIVSQSAPEHSATWNSQALPYQISGANLFVKFGARSLISVPATASGVGSANVTVTYTLGFPASKAKIYYPGLKPRSRQATTSKSSSPSPRRGHTSSGSLTMKPSTPATPPPRPIRPSRNGACPRALRSTPPRRLPASSPCHDGRIISF